MKKLNIQLTNGTKGSQSAKRLAAGLSAALGYKVFRTLKTKTKRTHLCYGQGVDKIKQYEWFAANGVPALEFTDLPAVAGEWLDKGHTVFGRTLLNSSCGKGILVFEPGAKFEPALVYTKYMKKKREFRVHVFRDQVVAVKEKKLRSNWNGPRDSKIRNLANGYVFCSCDSEPDGIRALAVTAAGVVSSDFKGVDIGYNEKLNQLFVIEVNSAPGIEGSNVQAYINAIINK